MPEPTPNDTRAVRALAHPLRLRLLDLLRFDGPSTATLLARRVGESSGATSYHLRLLARYGYIEEAQRGAGRERWWAYLPRPVILPGEGAYDPGARVLLAELLSREAYALDSFLAGPPGSEADEAAFFQSRAFRLTAAELDELRRGIETLLGPLRRADADDPPEGAVPVRVLAFGFPQATEDTDEGTA